jgi:hypothetical protein
MKPKQVWSIIVLVSLLAAAAVAPAGAAQPAPERAETLKIAISERIEDPTNFNMTN